MLASQGAGEGSTTSVPTTLAGRAYNVNDGFSAVDAQNNNCEDESGKYDEMALKTTVVSVLENGTATPASFQSKPGRSTNTWSRATRILFGIAVFLLFVGFILLLWLYIQEIQDTKSPGRLNEICLEDNCIRRSASKTIFIYVITPFYTRR